MIDLKVSKFATNSKGWGKDWNKDISIENGKLGMGL